MEMSNIVIFNNNVNKCNVPSPLLSLKRKRPSKLHIPNVLSEVCTDPSLDTSGTAAQDDAVCFGGHGVGVFSLKGKKKFMEDAHKVISSPHSKTAFFGVYDGHGGRKAAEFVADNLHSNIYKILENCGENEAKEAAVKGGYLKTDQEFLEQGLGSGACCVTALIEGKEMLVSNLGDCRGVLCRRGVAEALTKDHRAGQEDERRRIEDQGGYVEMHRGAWRVHGILSVSRSIGDAHLKHWVLAEPDTKAVRLTPDVEYLILASDGLWEEVGNQEAVDLVSQSCSRWKKAQATPRENGDEFGRVSPLSRSRRVVAVNCKRAGRSPGSVKTISRTNECEAYFGSENDSPPSKARRISEMDQTKVKVESPNTELDQANMKLQSPSNEKSDFEAQRVSESYQTKAKVQSPYISEIHHAKLNIQSPNNENIVLIAGNTPVTDCAKMNMQSPDKENDDGRLIAACRELVNLAVRRGSLDDITVMVIDLTQFMQ